MKRFTTLAMVATLLASCAGPRPQAPSSAAVVPPAGWRDARDLGPAPDAAWWTGFHDPALDAIVEQALRNNVDIAIAASRVEEARSQFRLAGAQRLPDLSLGVGGGYQRDVNAFGIGTDQRVDSAQATLSWDADLFGRLAKASDAARASLLATEAARDGVRLAVAGAAASGYVGLRALDARLVILRATLVARSEALKLARRRYETGYAASLDLSQSEAEYRSAEQLIPATLLAIRRQENGLSVLMGTTPGEVVRGTELSAIGFPTLPNDLPANLVRRRPDIAQAEQQLVAADASLDSVRASFLPDLRLSASGGLVGSSLIPDPISVFSLGASLLAPIFDAGRRRAQQGVAASRRDEAAFAYRRTALIAFREVEDAMATVDRSREQEVALVAQRSALDRALKTATERYRAGYSPYLDQLDAQRSLLGAELALAQSRSDRLTGQIALFQALGGGWRATEPSTIASAK
ncbi:efflux transporter outer membrane subunit [Sphingomonas glacialis]|uniref:Efflux transporter outer membrane subunit n=1 Tax=Sphingomonas glacialis TaxID=658225 RepID=A0A502G3Y8_9SPHN|nr:efflux transporter outer membrane subunit [Sphingomonas glacialis]TPG56535.1 efflux transporter outer membrane subunit [Sphingomonas glacialis]